MYIYLILKLKKKKKILKICKNMFFWEWKTGKPV